MDLCEGGGLLLECWGDLLWIVVLEWLVCCCDCCGLDGDVLLGCDMVVGSFYWSVVVIC